MKDQKIRKDLQERWYHNVSFVMAIAALLLLILGRILKAYGI